MNKFMQTFLMTFSIIVFVTSGYSQKSVKKPAPPPAPADNYWAAQRNIETAVTQLESFLKTAPSDDKRVQTVAAQIQMLKEVRAVPGKNEWSVLMNQYPHIPSIEWRVGAIDSHAERTVLNIEIRNTLGNGEQCFQSFDQNHLVLIDNKGQSVPMLEVGELPAGVNLGQFGYSGAGWCLAGNQTIFLNVDFAPLERGTTSGQISYSKYSGTGAQPTKFSLFKQNLNK